MKVRLACSIAYVFLATASPAIAQDSGTSTPTGGTSTDWAAMKAAFEAQTAAYNAAKAASLARKEAIEADQKADVASLGTVTGQTAITGTTTLKTGAGNAEALLLATRATQLAARDVVTQLTPALDSGWLQSKPLVLITSTSDLSLNDAHLFEFQRQRLGAQLTAAITLSNQALALPTPTRNSRDAAPDRAAFGTIAGGLLDMASKLGSYFQTDYELGALTVTAPDALDAGAVANALLRARPKIEVVQLNLAMVGDVQPVLRDLALLDNDYIMTVALGARAKAKAATVRTSHPDVAATLDAADVAATKAVTAYETFLTALMATPTNSATNPAPEPPLVRIVRQRKMQQALATGSKVLLVTSAKAAAYYTRKNLWTWLVNGPPLYTMGGTVMVYALIDPVSGRAFAEGAIAKHGGYRSVGRVEKLFQ